MSTNKTTNTNDKTTNEKSQNTRKGCKDKEKRRQKPCRNAGGTNRH